MTKVIDNVQRYRKAVSAATRSLGPGEQSISQNGTSFPVVAQSDLIEMARGIRSLAVSGAIFVAAPERRLYLTKNPNDPYGGNLQAAIDACENPTAEEPWVVEILSPGVYEGNFVVPEHVYLVSLIPGTTQAVILLSSSGNTLTMPDANSGATGLTVSSTSANPSDAAVNIVPGASPGDATRLVLMRANGTNAAASLRTQPGTGTNGPINGIYLDANGNAPVLIDLLGAGVVINLGGVTNFSPNGTAIHAANGSFSLLFESVLQTTAGGAGWLVEAEAGAAVQVFNSSTILVANGFKAETGAFVGLLNVTFLFAPTGPLLELDAISVGGLGQVQIATGGNPYDFIVSPVPANVVFFQSLTYREGLLAARPATPQPGMRYYATDRPAGTRQLTYVASLGWVDQTDAVVP